MGHFHWAARQIRIETFLKRLSETWGNTCAPGFTDGQRKGLTSCPSISLDTSVMPDGVT